MKYASLVLITCLPLAAFSQSVPPETAQDPNTVLTSNSKVAVTKADLDAELQRIPENDRFEFLLSRQRLATMVENILINKVLALEARQSGLDKDPKVIAEIQNQTEKILARSRGAHVRRSAPQVDLLSAARENYLLNKEKYKREALYETWVVQIMRGNDPAASKARAEECLRRARAGEPLDALAREYSDDAAARKAGGLNLIVPLTRLESSIAKVVVNLKQGEFSEVLDSPIGILVVQLNRLIPAATFSFDDIKSELLIDARNAYEATIANNHLNAIRNDPTLKVNVDALEKIRAITSISSPLPDTPFAPAAKK